MSRSRISLMVAMASLLLGACDSAPKGPTPEELARFERLHLRGESIRILPHRDFYLQAYCSSGRPTVKIVFAGAPEQPIPTFPANVVDADSKLAHTVRAIFSAIPATRQCLIL